MNVHNKTIDTLVLIVLLATTALLCSCSQQDVPHTVPQQVTLHLTKEDVAEAFNQFMPKFDSIPSKPALCNLDAKAKQKGIDLFYQGATFESMEAIRDVLSEPADGTSTPGNSITSLTSQSNVNHALRMLTASSMLVGFSSAMKLSETQSPDEVRRQISNVGGMCL